MTERLHEILKNLKFKLSSLSDEDIGLELNVYSPYSWYSKIFLFSGGKFEMIVDEQQILITPGSPNSGIPLVKMETNIENFIFLANKWELYD